MDADAEAAAAYREQVRLLSEALPAAVSIVDPRGTVVWVNPYWIRTTGLSFPDSVDTGWRAAVHADDLPILDEAFANARGALGHFTAEVRLRNANGDWRWSEIRAEPLSGEGGRLLGFISVCSDMHERRLAAEALEAERAHFRIVAENAPVMLWMTDVDGRCVYLNRALRAFWGAPEDLAGFKWADKVLDEDRTAFYAALDLALAARGPFEAEARYHRLDGEIRIVRSQANPRTADDGAFLGMIGVNTDVTDARRAERHQRLLVNELNHRVKNTLATVQSLAHQTLRAGYESDVAADVLEARLVALSAAHNVLNRENWEAADLDDIVAEALRPFQVPEAPRLTAAGPPVRVGPRAALALSLLLHELATNAVKYGALSVESGGVTIDWTARADGIDIVWREAGGPPVAEPARRGFGSRLLAGVAADLGGPAVREFAAAGVICRMPAPLARAGGDDEFEAALAEPASSRRA